MGAHFANMVSRFVAVTAFLSCSGGLRANTNVERVDATRSEKDPIRLRGRSEKGLRSIGLSRRPKTFTLAAPQDLGLEPSESGKKNLTSSLEAC